MTFDEARAWCCDHARDINNHKRNGSETAERLVHHFGRACGDHPGESNEQMFIAYTEEFIKELVDEDI